MKKKFFIYLRALRVNQWMKNLIIYISIIFSGQLFNPELFVKTTEAFFIFCLLFSNKHIFNNMIMVASINKYRNSVFVIHKNKQNKDINKINLKRVWKPRFAVQSWGVYGYVYYM